MSITLQDNDLKAMLIEAAAMGAKQAIEAARLATQTTPAKPQARERVTFKQLEQIIGLKQTAIRKRYIKKEGKHLYDPAFPKPHKLEGGKVNYFWLDEIIHWQNQQGQQNTSEVTHAHAS